MVFSSLLFIFRFLPITMLCYYIAPKKLKNLVMFIASLIFYSWGEVKYFPVMVAVILINYISALLLGKYLENKRAAKTILVIAIILNLGMLVFFKYTDFFIQNINNLFGTSIGLLNLTLPLGISFYTFQTMSYTIDVYRKAVPVERNIIDFSAYVVLFPQLIAGPIVKYSDINREMKTRTITLDKVEEGICIFIIGLAKKVLIANNIGMLWSEVETIGFSNISTPLAWLGILAFSLQIYFDFSGYSTMAIGLGKMLGFEFPQNFNFPYISKSVTEFWRRWHITLSSWFREYLYIPLGGNRKGQARTYFNLFIVWAATGFWHGASWNFLLWGLFFFVFLVIEKAFLLKYLEKSKVWSRIYIIPLLLFGWSLFAITDFSQLGIFLTKLFSFSATTNDWVYYLRNYIGVILVGILFCTPIMEKLYNKVKTVKVINVIIMAVLLLMSVAYLVDASYNPFLYFRF